MRRANGLLPVLANQMNTKVSDNYDVIVVGGGHAGVESALAAARAGARTLLLTQNIETLGQMSCNPAIGGIGKSHLVREIDALGGAMARAIDLAGIQWRILNASKGPAVRATRAQADRTLYKKAILQIVSAQENLQIFQQTAVDLLVQDQTVVGVMTQMGVAFGAPAVVLTTGTFLGGRIHIGLEQQDGGRAGDAPANALARRLRALPLQVGRLKTGTPPRIDGTSVDFSVMQMQPGDQPLPVMSYLGQVADHPRQLPCYITRTNARTHDIVRAALDRSPLYSGAIQGTGPRYCPSIEDKVVRFADRDHHQIFVEPEGLDTQELYPNGISTSLPFDVQRQMVRSIEGFANAHITRAGYAIEYDYLDPRGLDHSLQSRQLEGLFLAGQINGTTGYEEAAAQGLVAGLNAARKATSLPAWHPPRYNAYIGVMIDDLVSHGVTEPYRMFTSRAEYRLRLREDNADLRLTPAGRSLGLVDDARWAFYSKRQADFQRGLKLLHDTHLSPASDLAEHIKAQTGLAISRRLSLFELLKRPEVRIRQLTDFVNFQGLSPDILTQLETEVRYVDYISRQTREIEQLRRQEHLKIPHDFQFDDISGLSTEQRHRLQEQRPANLAAAARLQGITPAALSLLALYLKKASGQRSAARTPKPAKSAQGVL